MRLILVLLAALPPLQDPSADKEGLEFFEKKIRPVLAERCYSCHAAEAKKVKGGLYLDTREGVLKGGDTGPALVPGDPEKSLIVQALRWTDDDLKMPPKNRLPAAVVADFEAWIRRGAPDPRAGGAKAAKAGIDLEKGRQHWSLKPLRADPVPEVRNAAWGRTPVDRFILAKLEEKGVTPNGPADRRRLIRRATLDLTGLPPTPEEVDAFLKDESPGAYEKALDRLLASPAYGERWARFWLDVARFAESHGFEQDYDREGAYHYRDFVIQALNQDMPYDRFVQWQIAGDELAPDDPLAWMATGFLGAGAFPTQLTEAEFESARYDELDNMGSTVGSAMLGLSVGCARCHDHKFDPIPAKDYYRFISAFTTAIRSHKEFDMDSGGRQALAAWEKSRAAAVAALEAFEKNELPGRYDRWTAARAWEKVPAAPWAVLDILEIKSKGKTTFTKAGDGSLLVTGENPNRDSWIFKAQTALERVAAVRIEALADPSLKKHGPGRADNGNFALSEVRVLAAPLGGGAEPVAVKLRAAQATFQQNDGTLSAASAIDGDKGTGWAVDPQFGKNHAIVFEFERPVGFPGGTALTVELDFWVNQRHVIGRPRVSVAPAPAEPSAAGREQSAAEFLEDLRAGRTRPRDRALAGYRAFDPEWSRLHGEIAALDLQRPVPKLTKVLVTTEGLKPLKHHADERGFPHFYKETHFLARGDVNKKQGAVTPGFLQVLVRDGTPESRWLVPPPPGTRTPHTRSALARWVTDVEQGAGALAARVIVNRLWQHHFGRGLVSTPNDFGLQGDLPTHPELLDWLAGELIRGGWRLKPLHHLLMRSAVYLEGAEADPARAKLDPDNRLFWRRELRRLEGEAIRDSMLAVSGMLDRRMYGPGTLDEGMNRRSIYFFVKRSHLIPMMTLFDAPEALVSIGRRPSTTVAPQALLFMNSPHVRRYAAAFARRLGPDPVRTAYRMAFGRGPTPEEEKAAADFLASYAKGQEGAALADLCQVLFSTSEFIYVE